ncbi:hypothetical protein JCM10207_002191 [Rhodosporidiobolus poonsookiae]
MSTWRRIDNFLRVKPDPKDETGGTRSRWSNPDLDPPPAYKRTWTMIDLCSFWSSDNFGPGTWTAGSSLIALGFTAREVIPFAFAGALMCSIVAYYNAVAGSRTGCCFPVLARASFGPWAALVPVFVRALVGLIWLVVLTFQAADVTSLCISAVFPSYNTAIKNAFPESSGVTSQQLLSMFIYWIFQTALNLVPIYLQKHLFNVKGIICPLTFIALLIWGLVVTDGGNSPYINGDGTGTMGGGKVMAVFTGINSMASVASTIACNVPDFSRFQRPTKYAWTQIVFMPITATIPIACGVITTSAVYTHYGIDGAWQPAALIINFGSRAVRFFVGASFLLAYVGVNISANSVAFANDFSSIFPRYFNFRRTTIFASLLCFLMQPWFLLSNAAAFLSFLGLYGSFLSGVASILVTDFWILRRGKVDIRELFKGGDGIYWYWHGINWRAVAAWVISFAPNLPGLAHAINTDIPDVNPYTYCFSWGWGTFWAGSLYYLFSTLFPPHKTFVDEAICMLDGTPNVHPAEVDSSEKLDEEAGYVVSAEDK